jgi:hypothetical protein
VAKLNAAGSALVYATYLGGSNPDSGTGIAVDAAGNAYVTGYTGSTNFPTTNPLQPANKGFQNAFVAKLNAAGSALVYATYLGGSGTDAGQGIAVDAAGNAYVTGQTTSTDFPTANALQPANGGGADAFVAKLNAAGTALAYSTYLGGSADDSGDGIAVDSQGNAYVTGATTSTNFPTANPLQPAYGGNSDAFVAKLNAMGSALVYATYLGGSGDDVGQGIAVDSQGNAYVTGYTGSTNFPTANTLQPANGGGQDAFLAKIATAPLSLLSLAATASQVFTGPVAFFTDNRGPNPAANFTAFITWGDGISSSGTIVPFSGGFEVVGSHSYSAAGSYILAVTIQSQDGQTASASKPVLVADPPLSALSHTVTFKEGVPATAVVASFTDPDPHPTPGEYSATISWGDGSSSAGTIVANGGGFDVSASHSYAEEGTYPITVTIQDAGTGAVTANSTATVAGGVFLTGLTKDLVVFGHKNFSGQLATFVDADADGTTNPYSASIDWGDGTVTAGTVTLGQLTGQYTVSGSHLFPAFAETRQITIAVTDNGGGGTETFTVQDTAVDPPYPGTANQLYVAQLYQDLLGRSADAAGLTAWSGLLDQGVSRSQVAHALAASPEYRADEVESLYRQYLHREADATGLADFSRLLANGGTVEQAAALLAGSAEYYQARGGGTDAGFLAALYQDGLGRAVDGPGQAAWQGALAGGWTRSQVAAALLASTEYQEHLVQGDYQRYLLRPADGPGLDAFVAAMKGGARDEDVIAALAGSDEYVAALAAAGNSN